MRLGRGAGVAGISGTGLADTGETHLCTASDTDASGIAAGTDADTPRGRELVGDARHTLPKLATELCRTTSGTALSCRVAGRGTELWRCRDGEGARSGVTCEVKLLSSTDGLGCGLEICRANEATEDCRANGGDDCEPDTGPSAVEPDTGPSAVVTAPATGSTALCRGSDVVVGAAVVVSLITCAVVDMALAGALITVVPNE